jgi:hypothetical protein
VQISRDAAGGEVFATPPDTIDAAERILQEIEEVWVCKLEEWEGCF